MILGDIFSKRKGAGKGGRYGIEDMGAVAIPFDHEILDQF
jgi:hypothetical protein